MNYQLLTGDNRAVLRTLPAKSIHAILTKNGCGRNAPSFSYGEYVNSDYIELAHARIREAINASGRAPVVRVGKAADYESMPLFAEAA